MKTIIKIKKEERDLLAKFCAECLVPCEFYIMENNDNLLQAEIGSDSPSILFSLGKMLGMAVMAEYTNTL